MSEMALTDTVTAHGTGTWYRQYNVVLATTSDSLRSRYAQKEMTFVQYELRFNIPGSKEWDCRRFDTDSSRDAFIQRSFSQLSIEAVSEPKLLPASHVLSSSVGERLDSITADFDLINLRFGQHRLGAYDWPMVHLGMQAHSPEEAGYLERLRSFIGKQVARFEEYVDAGLVFEFSSGLSLEIPTAGPSVSVTYCGPRLGYWDWSRPGGCPRELC